jgi:hypothetical protein
MSAYNRVISTISGAPLLTSGSTLDGSGDIIFSEGITSIALIVSLNSSGAIVALDGDNNIISLTVGLQGNGAITFQCDGNILAVIDPQTGTFSSVFSAVADLRGFLSMSGEFTSSQTQTTVDYQGKIYVSSWGADGYTYPSGTATQPVATLAAARTLADKYNIKEIHIQGTHELQQNYENFFFVGWGTLASCAITLNPLYNIENCKFDSLTIYGVQKTTFPMFPPFLTNLGTIQYDNCYLYAVTGLAGNLVRCQLSGHIDIEPGKWISGTKIVIEGDDTVFDLGGVSGTTISLDIDSGWFQAVNAVTGALIELNAKGCEVSLDSSCTGGEYYLEGVGNLFNDSAMTKKENHFIWDDVATYHGDIGSTGKALLSAGSAGDPWSTVLPNGYTGVQAGAILDQIKMLTDELHTIQGLNASSPMTVTPTSRVAGDIELELTGDGATQTVVTRV